MCDGTYPAYRYADRRVLLGDLTVEWRPVCGRLVRGRGGLALRDASATVRLGCSLPLGSVGDLVSAVGRFDDDGLLLRDVEIVVVGSGSASLASLLPAVSARHRAYGAIRRYFAREGFLEVTTPTLVAEPGTDVHLATFATRFSGMGPVSPQPLFLHTSPELVMKRLLCAGAERIFQICPAYRDAEHTRKHNPEFTIVEWYRAWADWRPIIADTEAVVRAVLPAEVVWQGRVVCVDQPFVEVTVQEAFLEHCGLDILALDSVSALTAAARRAGLSVVPSTSWSDVYFQLLVEHVEPKLGWDVPTVLTRYPRELAVLSRVCDDDPRVAERFELYIAGVELCNGFTELNDPVEQRTRFSADLAQRRALGLPELPMPETFLADLEAGMPPAGGVALGFDRLLQLALGTADIGDVLVRSITGVHS